MRTGGAEEGLLGYRLEVMLRIKQVIGHADTVIRCKTGPVDTDILDLVFTAGAVDAVMVTVIGEYNSRARLVSRDCRCGVFPLLLVYSEYILE